MACFFEVFINVFNDVLFTFRIDKTKPFNVFYTIKKILKISLIKKAELTNFVCYITDMRLKYIYKSVTKCHN